MKSDYPDQMRGGGGRTKPVDGRAKPVAKKPLAKTRPHKIGGKKGY